MATDPIDGTGFGRRPLDLSRRGALTLGAAGAAGLITSRAAWAQTGGTPPSKPTGQVVIGLSQEPTVFNPLMIAIEVDQGVWWSLYDPLWGVDPAGNFIPQLATEVPTVENGGVSADGLSWRIKLRDGVKWHDGTPFTAEDVKFSLELNNNPKFRAARRTGHEFLRDVTVVSPTEITWKMAKPYAPYISILSWTFIIPKHIADTADPNSTPLNTSPVGTGPFRWSERQPGDHITLVANPNYYRKGPYLERVTYKYIPDLTVLYTQFRTGEVDAVGIQGITPDHYAEAKTLPDRKVVLIGAAFIESITMNLGRCSRTRRCARRSTRRWTGRASSTRSTTACRRPPKATCRASPGRSTRTCRCRTTTLPRRSRSSMPPAGSRAPMGCARRAACGWSSPTPPPPATTCANRRSSFCSRTGRKSAPR
jgi:ABC-type transport system substrate-binding protein